MRHRLIPVAALALVLGLAVLWLLLARPSHKAVGAGPPPRAAAAA